MKIVATASLALLLISFTHGCSRHDSWKAKTSLTTGSMRINGEIPVGAQVYFLPLGAAIDSRGSRPYAAVGQDGTYSMTTYKAFDGAPPGEYAVTVVWPTNQHTHSSPDRLGNKFDSIEEAPLKVSIIKGRNVIPPFNLIAEKVTPADAAKNKLVP